MTDRDALLRAVLTNPADDVARLVYADWLEEHGGQERAEFIRLQVAEPGRAVLFGRKKMPGGRWQWGVTRFGGPGSFRWERLATDLARTALSPEARTVRRAWRNVRVTINRGFISRLEVPLRDWVQHGPTLVLEQPVESLKIAPQLEPRDDLIEWAKRTAGLLGPGDDTAPPSGGQGDSQQT